MGGTHTRRRTCRRTVCDPMIGPVAAPRVDVGSGLAGHVVTISYNFVQQLFVYDMIVDIVNFGRSPTRFGLPARRRLATCNDRDYDPCPASGGHIRPGCGDSRPGI